MDVLIFEKNPLHAKLYQNVIGQLGHKVCGVCDNAEKAMCLFEDHSPDLALINVNPTDGMVGLRLGRWFKSMRNVILIYIADSLDEESYKDMSQTMPFAYIVKPVDEDALSRILNLAFESHVAKERVNVNHQLNGHAFFVKTKQDFVKIRHSEITHIKAEDKYCEIHLDNGKSHLKRTTIKKLNKELSSQEFVQSHRGYIVNVDKVERVNLHDFTIQIRNHTVPLGSTYKNHFLEKVGMQIAASNSSTSHANNTLLSRKKRRQNHGMALQKTSNFNQLGKPAQLNLSLAGIS